MADADAARKQRRVSDRNRALPPLVSHRIELSYVGTGFAGWQRQKGKPSIQEALESAVERIWGRRLTVTGASRTDAGVHALRQVASFAAPRKLAPDELVRALNYFLPGSIRVRSARLAAPGFHARFSACAKTYEYRIWNHAVLDPFLSGRTWHIPIPLELRAMREAGELFVGTKDFAAFASNSGRAYSSAVRTISRLDISRSGPLLRIRVVGDGFLYHMVRNIVGALARVGKGRLSREELQEILESGERRRAPASAPPWGLYLIRVHYPSAKRRRLPAEPRPNGVHLSSAPGMRSRHE